MQLSNGARLSAPMILLGIMALAMVLLMLRSAGLYPGVLGDEYTYSTMSRSMPLSEAFIPGYLYLAIYNLTNMCGSGFLFCSKFFNTLFFVAAAPFIYLVARRFCGLAVSLLIVAISLLGPVNSYTAYYMPEPLFFLSFWISIWYFLGLDVNAPAKKWLLFGFMMGCSALVKPHALLIIPGFCLCILFFSYKGTEKWLTVGLKNAALFVGSLFATKFIISFLVAGKAGLTLFGSFYNSTLQSSASTLQRYLDILMVTPTIVEGHLLANTVMFGTAVAIILFGSIKALANPNLSSDDRIAFCTLALWLNLIAMVTLFSASVAGTNAIETDFRVHMRYYNFMLPLLFIAAGSQLDRMHGESLKYWRLAVALLVLAILGYAALTYLHPYTPSYVDSPELRGFTLNSTVFMLLAGFCAFTVLLWYKSASAGSIVFVCLYLPVSIAISTAYNNAEVRQRMVIDTYDKAGLFAKSYVPENELSQLAVIGENPAHTLRALVYVDNRHAVRDLSYVPGQPYSAAQTAYDKKWILAIGDVQFAEDEFDVIKLNGFSLAKKDIKRYPLQLGFNNAQWPALVANISGLESPEAWGAWSTGPAVTIELKKPLPAQFDLMLNAKAFGPNAGQAINVEVEGRLYPFDLGVDMTPRTLRITTSGKAQSLTIRIPSPVSPKTLGVSQDDRPLGIGLEQLDIREVR